MLCLCSCREAPYPKALHVADSLANVKPDSAISVLQSLKGEMATASEEVQMYHHLLCIKANDKAYIPHTSDSLIRVVLHYYIDKADERHLPEAYYYAGRVFRDLGDVPQALDYLSKAIQALPDDANNPFKRNIYSQMGTLFLYQNIYDEALKVFKDLLRCDSLQKDSVSMVYSLRDLADAYRGIEKLDSALYYYQKSSDLAYTLKCPSLICMAQSQIASICVQLKEYDRAKIALGNSFNTQNRVVQCAVYSIASKLYRQTGCTDSAVYYYKRSLECGSIYGKKNANWGLAEVALENNNPQDALLYLKEYMACNDSVAKIANAEAVRKMNSLYNYQLREKENERLKAENDKNAFIIICFVGVSIILVIVIIAYRQYSRRKRLWLDVRLKDAERLKEEQYRKSVRFIEENNRKIEELEKKLQDADCINNELKMQLEQQQEKIIYMNKQAQIDMDEHAMKLANFKKTEIYNHLSREIASGTYKMSKGNWDTLEKTVNEIFDDFTGKLNNIYKLSKHELEVSLLIKADIQPSEIANLTNHTKASVSAVRRRLYEKFFGKPGEPKMWDEFILSL